MILAKSALRQAVEKRELQFLDDTGIILPEWFGVSMGQLGEDPIALQPASVDLSLGNEWAVPHPNYLWGLGEECTRTRCAHPRYYGDKVCDSRAPIEYKREESASFMIPAHGFVLARTKEIISISENLFGKVEGRSSVGRTGLIVETAGVIDPGFVGSITLELFNCLPYPLLVHAGVRICQIVVSRIDGSSEGGYKSDKYQGQVGTTGSKLHMDFVK